MASAPWMPSGLVNSPRPSPSSGRGLNAADSARPAVAAAPTQATGRQRFDGRCPLGNSSSTNDSSPSTTYHGQRPTQAMASPPGTPPRFWTSAR
jgi:hypothetical protein